jgi:hypothetical protein
MDETAYVQSLAIPYQPYAQMTGGTATLTTAGTTYTVAGYSASTASTDGIVSLNTSTGLATANRSGLYNILGQVLFTSGTTSYRTLYITINASTIINSVNQTSVGFVNHNIQIFGIYYLTAGDTIKIQGIAGLAAQSISAASLTVALV